MASPTNQTTSSKKGPLQPLALLTFFKIYLGVFAAAALDIAGLALLLIGATAAGMRVALQSPDGRGE